MQTAVNASAVRRSSNRMCKPPWGRSPTCCEMELLLLEERSDGGAPSAQESVRDQTQRRDVDLAAVFANQQFEFGVEPRILAIASDHDRIAVDVHHRAAARQQHAP